MYPSCLNTRHNPAVRKLFPELDMVPCIIIAFATFVHLIISMPEAPMFQSHSKGTDEPDKTSKKTIWAVCPAPRYRITAADFQGVRASPTHSILLLPPPAEQAVPVKYNRHRSVPRRTLHNPHAALPPRSRLPVRQPDSILTSRRYLISNNPRNNVKNTF